MARATYDKYVRVERLHTSELRRQLGCPRSLKLELFLDKALLLEVEYVHLARLGSQVVNTVLVLVAIARADCHHRGVQVLGRTRACGCGNLCGVVFGFLDSVSGAFDWVLAHVDAL